MQRFDFPLDSGSIKENETAAVTISFSRSAVRRGLEPLTPCVTGTYSNQLNQRTVFRIASAKIVLFSNSTNFLLTFF